MSDFYEIFDLNKNSSSRIIFRRLQKIIRKEIEENQETNQSLRAFVILSNNTLRKFYDKTISHPRTYPKLENRLASASDRYARRIQSVDIRSTFDEKEFLRKNWHSIFLSTFGLDYLLRGVGSTDPDYSQSNYQASKAGQAAFFANNIFYFGIPIFLGIMKPILWWTLVPFIIYKANKEYWRIKHEYYFENEN